MNEIEIKTTENDLWVETYRPKFLDDIIGHEQVIKRLKKYVETNNSMNFLFAGPPATGKTTAAIAFARELYGESYRSNFIEMNASDQRGIDVVRNEIKDYSQTQPINASFKIIFLDEVDELTGPAQSALRRTMEKSHKTCRFILSCNYDNKLIQPIRSRLTSFYFGGLNEQDMFKLVERVAAKENVNITNEAITTLVSLSDKDARTVLNTLQTSAIISDEVTEDVIRQTLQVPDRNVVKNMMVTAIEGDIDKAFIIMSNHIVNSGFDVKRVLFMMSNIIPEFELENIILIKFFDILSDGEARINEGNSIDLQMRGILSKMAITSRMNPVCMQGNV